MNKDDNLDLLDLNDDEESIDDLPETTPFAAPRPKKPWLLLAVGLVVIILATYIIIRIIGSDSSSSMEVDLDAPAVIVEGEVGVPANVEPTEIKQSVSVEEDKLIVPPVVNKEVQKTKQVVKEEPEKVGTPVRVVEDRKDVSFNPDKVEEKKNVTKPATKTVAKKTVAKQQVAPKGSWYVQFGSYSTRALAEEAQRKIQNAHKSLFSGKQFVILAAVLQNGTTTYRLRIAFATASEANGFCRNAKSDGLDCYVAK